MSAPVSTRNVTVASVEGTSDTCVDTCILFMIRSVSYHGHLRAVIVLVLHKWLVKFAYFYTFCCKYSIKLYFSSLLFDFFLCTFVYNSYQNIWQLKLIKEMLSFAVIRETPTSAWCGWRHVTVTGMTRTVT